MISILMLVVTIHDRSFLDDFPSGLTLWLNALRKLKAVTILLVASSSLQIKVTGSSQ